MRRASFLTVCVVSCLLTAGIGAAQTSDSPASASSEGRRPRLNPVTMSAEYERALVDGTRSPDGAPGPAYWQQWSDYRLIARLHPGEKWLEGTATIDYHNNSPDTLSSLFIQLNQNVHSPGSPRIELAEITGGVELHRVTVDGQQLDSNVEEGPRYRVQATRMEVVPPNPVAPGARATLEIEWAFRVPKDGASGRMGWDADNLFFLAYWYPQMAVYDDVVGWQSDWFLAGAEFYAGFGSYDLTVQVPEGWVVAATGTLQNPEEVLAPHVLERLRHAELSDEVVQVIGADDFGNRSTQMADEGWLSWNFWADTVRDVAFSATRESYWDAARTPVGDRDGDGTLDYARVDAIYREAAPRWRETARYAQHSIDFLSRFTGFSYPWPHMTAVEGSGIIGGGMEFPMMTLIGDYNERGDSALYYVTAHELAHMWVPMIVSNDERRYSWMDEGTTTFNENQARKEFFPGFNSEAPDQDEYTALARARAEGEMMRRSDFHYTRDAFGVASYEKPASVLVALRAVLGEETFMRAYHSYIERWAYKHPYPWDMFSTLASVSGRDLDWFWRSWYYETWILDQAIAGVETDANGTRILIEDRGEVPMPVLLTITLDDGQVIEREVPVEEWSSGARTMTVTVLARQTVQRVEIDTRRSFPDTDRANNVWPR